MPASFLLPSHEWQVTFSGTMHATTLACRVPTHRTSSAIPRMSDDRRFPESAPRYKPGCDPGGINVAFPDSINGAPCLWAEENGDDIRSTVATIVLRSMLQLLIAARDSKSSFSLYPSLRDVAVFTTPECCLQRDAQEKLENMATAARTRQQSSAGDRSGAGVPGDRDTDSATRTRGARVRPGEVRHESHE